MGQRDEQEIEVAREMRKDVGVRLYDALKDRARVRLLRDKNSQIINRNRELESCLQTQQQQNRALNNNLRSSQRISEERRTKNYRWEKFGQEVSKALIAGRVLTSEDFSHGYASAAYLGYEGAQFLPLDHSGLNLARLLAAERKIAILGEMRDALLASPSVGAVPTSVLVQILNAAADPEQSSEYLRDGIPGLLEAIRRYKQPGLPAKKKKKEAREK